MSDPIKPATDEEIAALKGCLVRFDAGEVTLGGPQFASGCERLIARIDADTAKLRERDEQIARYEGLILAYGDTDTAAQKAEEKGGGYETRARAKSSCWGKATMHPPRGEAGALQ